MYVELHYAMDEAIGMSADELLATGDLPNAFVVPDYQSGYGVIVGVTIERGDLGGAVIAAAEAAFGVLLERTRDMGRADAIPAPYRASVIDTDGLWANVTQRAAAGESGPEAVSV